MGRTVYAVRTAAKSHGNQACRSRPNRLCLSVDLSVVPARQCVERSHQSCAAAHAQETGIVSHGPLRLLVQLGEGETAPSFAHRLGRRNGTVDGKSFCSAVGLSYARLSAGEPAEIRRLACLGGADADQLIFHSPHLQERGWFVIGHARLKFTALARRRDRFCPACLREDREHEPRFGPIHRGLWQVVVLRVCPRHNCFLGDLKDGAAANDPARSLAEPTAPAARPLESYLRDRIIHGVGETWLDAQAFHAVQLFCEALGTLIVKGPGAKAKGLKPHELVAAGSAGFEVLRGGPTAVRSMLFDLWHDRGKPSRAYGKLYRPLLSCLVERRDDPAFNDLRGLVRDYVLDTFHVPQGTSLLGEECGRPRVHTIATAAKCYEVPRSRLARQLGASGQLEAEVRNSGARHHEILIPVRDIEAAVAEVRGLSSMATAGARLGLDRHQMERLCVDGLLRPQFDKDGAMPLYAESEIMRFVASLRAACRHDHQSGPDHQPLPVAATRCHCATTWLIRRVQSGELSLTSTRPDPFHFADFLVSLSAVKEMLLRIPEGTVTTAQAAKLLSVKPRTVHALAAQGYLTASLTDFHLANRARRLFDPVEVDNFARVHVVLRILPGQRKAKYLALQQFVSANGIQPLQLRETDEKIFRRVEIEMISSLPGGENLDRLLAFPEGNADPDKHETKDSNPENNPEQEAGI